MCHDVQVQFHIVCMTLLSVLLILPLDTVEASCTFEDKEVCEGKIVKEIGKSLVKICIDGKLKIKPRKKISPWPGYGGSCMWYGEVLCDGAVVQVGLHLTFYFYILFFLHAGPVPMVVSVKMFKIQDVSCEQILARRHIRQEIQS